MNHLLVAMTIKPMIAPELKHQALVQLKALEKELEAHCDVTVAVHEDNVFCDNRIERIARARNNLLDIHLLPSHDYVFWIDADVIEYPEDLPYQLYNKHPDSVVAPLVLIQKTNLFYDNLGFIENGGITESKPPYFAQRGNPVNLDSVGCCYLIPACVYEHAKYQATTVNRKSHHWSLWISGHTDHWSVMCKAAEMGYPILCDKDFVAYHADLNAYGETWNK